MNTYILLIFQKITLLKQWTALLMLTIGTLFILQYFVADTEEP